MDLRELNGSNIRGGRTHATGYLSMRNIDLTFISIILFMRSCSGICTLRASLCKILISSFAHKMDFAHIFSVDFF